MNNFWRKLPNLITYSRLAVMPLFVLLMIDPAPWMITLATVLFILAALTDWIDGFVARRYGAVSDFGKLLDPVADKIQVMTALVMLVAQRSDIWGEPWVPGWMVVLILARETWVTALRAVAAKRGVIIAANSTGKLKSAFQMFAIVLLLLHERSFHIFGFQLTCQMVGVNLLLVSLALSYWGAMDYTREVLMEQLEPALEPEASAAQPKDQESLN